MPPQIPSILVFVLSSHCENFFFWLRPISQWWFTHPWQVKRDKMPVFNFRSILTLVMINTKKSVSIQTKHNILSKMVKRYGCINIFLFLSLEDVIPFIRLELLAQTEEKKKKNTGHKPLYSQSTLLIIWYSTWRSSAIRHVQTTHNRGC